MQPQRGEDRAETPRRRRRGDKGANRFAGISPTDIITPGGIRGWMPALFVADGPRRSRRLKMENLILLTDSNSLC